MSTTQKLLGNILKKRINEELKKENKDFTSIQETMDIFLVGNKITMDQYSELTELINSVA